MGHTHVNHLLSTLNVPTISHTAYKAREWEVGRCVEAVVQESCKNVICKEKDNSQSERAGVVEMAAYTTWDGKKEESGTTLQLGMVLSWVSQQGKGNGLCYQLQKLQILCTAQGKGTTTYNCRKNHKGSSKSMESSVACELWNKAPLSNTRYTIYVGDDDTTTLCQMQEKVPYGVEKWSDITHAKRSLTTRLYNISQHNKFTDCSPLTQKVINYLAKCFSYCVAQNKGNPVELKKSLSEIIPHYTHKDLPHGKDLYGNKLKKYYGGSESSDFRVACGIAQVNIGYGYISNTLERLNIEPGAFCAEYVTKMDRKSHTAKLRKAKKEAIYRRNQLRRQKN